MQANEGGREGEVEIFSQPPPVSWLCASAEGHSFFSVSVLGITPIATLANLRVLTVSGHHFSLYAFPAPYAPLEIFSSVDSL